VKRHELISLLASTVAVAALAVIFTGALPVVAQDYPARPITLVVPFPAGGGNDALARVVAEKMSRTLGQQVVVENRGGAGGTIATRAVANRTARSCRGIVRRNRSGMANPCSCVAAGAGQTGLDGRR